MRPHLEKLQASETPQDHIHGFVFPEEYGLAGGSHVNHCSQVASATSTNADVASCMSSEGLLFFFGAPLIWIFARLTQPNEQMFGVAALELRFYKSCCGTWPLATSLWGIPRRGTSPARRRSVFRGSCSQNLTWSYMLMLGLSSAPIAVPMEL